jgi:hypothetical protein
VLVMTLPSVELKINSLLLLVPIAICSVSLIIEPSEFYYPSLSL